MAIPLPILGTLFEAVASLAKEIVNPLFKAIDEANLTEDEKAHLRARAEKAEAAIISSFLDSHSRVVEAEAEMAKAQAEIQKAEVASTGWLAKSWRPLGMYLFLFLIGWNYFGSPVLNLPASPMPEFMARVIEVSFVGVAGFRTTEKILPKILQVLSQFRKGK